MGDMSAEPSMEDILSSIKRIIAEEGDTSTPRHRRVQGRAAPLPMGRDEEDDEDEVLELSDPISPPTPPPPAPPPVEPRPIPAARAAAPQHYAPAADHQDAQAAHVSAATVEATRGALGSLSRLLVKPEPDSDGTLEGLVREMLRPMVSAWLDRNLPGIVEQLVAREIAKITAGQ
jgi:cell pole-organizing protein PopZ